MMQLSSQTLLVVSVSLLGRQSKFFSFSNDFRRFLISLCGLSRLVLLLETPLPLVVDLLHVFSDFYYFVGHNAIAVKSLQQDLSGDLVVFNCVLDEELVQLGRMQHVVVQFFDPLLVLLFLLFGFEGLLLREGTLEIKQYVDRHGRTLLYELGSQLLSHVAPDKGLKAAGDLIG